MGLNLYLIRIKEEEVKANRFSELETLLEENTAEVKHWFPQIYTLTAYLDESLIEQLEQSGYELTLQEKTFTTTYQLEI